jgi:hypothetical protein
LIAFETRGFFSWDHRYQTSTLEFWLTGDVTGLKDEYCLVGFDTLDFFDDQGNPIYDTHSVDDLSEDYDVDGVFFSGNVIFVRYQGQHVCSAPLTTIEYPNLIHIVFLENSISIMVNGKTVASNSFSYQGKEISTGAFGITSTWFHSERKYAIVSNSRGNERKYFFEVDAFAIYPYAVSSVLAKKRFIRGQGVEDVDLFNNAIGAESINSSYDAAAQSPSAVYPSDFPWTSGVLSDLEIVDKKLSLKRHREPDIVGVADFDATEHGVYFAPSSSDDELNAVRFSKISSYVSDAVALLYMGNAKVEIRDLANPNKWMETYGDYWSIFFVTDDPDNPVRHDILDKDAPLHFASGWEDHEHYDFISNITNCQVEISDGEAVYFGIMSDDNYKNNPPHNNAIDPPSGFGPPKLPKATYLWCKKQPLNKGKEIPQKEVDIATTGYFYDNIHLDFFSDPETKELNSLQFNFTYPASTTKFVNYQGFYEPSSTVKTGIDSRYINCYVAFTSKDNFFVPDKSRLDMLVQPLKEDCVVSVLRNSDSQETFYYPVVNGTTLDIGEEVRDSTMHVYIDFSSPGQKTIPLHLDYLKITPANKTTTTARDGHKVTLPSSGLFRIAPQTNEYLYRGNETGWLNLDENENIVFDVDSDVKILSFFMRKNYIARYPNSFVRLRGDNDVTLNINSIDKVNYNFSPQVYSSYDVWVNGRQFNSSEKLALNNWYHCQVVGDFGNVTSVELGPHAVFDNFALFEDDYIKGRYLYNVYVGRNGKQSIADDAFAMIEGTSRVFNNVKRETHDIKV